MTLPRESSRVLAKVFTALRAAGITVPAVARDLGLAPGEFSAHVLGLVPVALHGRDSGHDGRRPDLRLITTT